MYKVLTFTVLICHDNALAEMFAFELELLLYENSPYVSHLYYEKNIANLITI